MKEIIYLDTNLVNSLLAQQNAGLITKLVNEVGSSVKSWMCIEGNKKGD